MSTHSPGPLSPAIQPRAPEEIIHGERVRLDKLRLDLAQQMFDYIDQDRPRLRRFLNWAEVMLEVADEANFIKGALERWNARTAFDYGMFDGDTYMGNVGVHTISWQHGHCELGYWILGDFEGKGFVRDAVNALCDEMFRLGFERIEIRCDVENERSATIPLACGFLLEGVLRRQQFDDGRYCDMKMFARLKS